MPRPQPIIIPGPSGMGGLRQANESYVDLGAILKLYDALIRQPGEKQANIESAQALAPLFPETFQGQTPTTSNITVTGPAGGGATEGIAPAGSSPAGFVNTADGAAPTGYAVNLPVPPKPPLVDINRLAASEFGQNILKGMAGAKFGALTTDKLMALSMLGGDWNKAQQIAETKRGPQTAGDTVMGSSEQMKEFKVDPGKVYRVVRDKLGNVMKVVGEAQPNWASIQEAEPGSIEKMGNDLAAGRTTYDMVQRNLQRSVKAQTEFVNYMAKAYPKFNYWESTATAKYYNSANVQDRLRFIDSLIGNPAVKGLEGSGGQMEYVKQLSDQVDRTQYPAINKGFLAFYRNYAGDEPSANFFAGLYNVALESARASAGTGSVIPQERVDQELERLSGAYNKGQIDSVLNVVRNEIMMRRREITKGTPGAVREKKPAAKPEKPETINLNQFWRK